MRTHAEQGVVRIGNLRRWKAAVLSVTMLLLSGGGVWAQRPVAKAKDRLPQCRRAVLEGTVHAGQGFQVEFARGLVFGLEPIQSGWALRVVAAGRSRGPHDYAEVATLPYQSVSPLLLSTDWAFRAQDAVGWTPRRFHFAASERAFAALAGGYDAVLRGDGAASQRAAVLAEAQPEGVLEIEDATLAPGMANQTGMAAAVSARFAETPHALDGNAPPSPLGRLEEIRFRVSMDLPVGIEPTQGVRSAVFACPERPTVGNGAASQASSKRISDEITR